VGGALAIFIGVITGVVIVVNRQSANSTVVPPAMPVTARPTTTTATPDVPLACDVELRASPSAARLTMDGAPLAGNPFHASYARDGTSHKVRATAPGFLPEERTIAFDRDTALEIALRPVPPGTTPPPVETQPGMGVDIKRDTRPKHSIDEKDPYK
jgi:serine/threonine-protein kinase